MIYTKNYLTFADVLSNRQESLPYLWFSDKKVPTTLQGYQIIIGILLLAN